MKGGVFMYTDIFYNSQIIDDLMQIAEELIAVINNWLNEHIQEIIHIVYLLISELADKYYFDTELQNDGSRTVFDTSPRSPPQERISVKMQVYFLLLIYFPTYSKRNYVLRKPDFYRLPVKINCFFTYIFRRVFIMHAFLFPINNQY